MSMTTSKYKAAFYLTNSCPDKRIVDDDTESETYTEIDSDLDEEYEKESDDIREKKSEDIRKTRFSPSTSRTSAMVEVDETPKTLLHFPSLTKILFGAERSKLTVAETEETIPVVNEADVVSGAEPIKPKKLSLHELSQPVKEMHDRILPTLADVTSSSMSETRSNTQLSTLHESPQSIRLRHGEVASSNISQPSAQTWKMSLPALAEGAKLNEKIRVSTKDDSNLSVKHIQLASHEQDGLQPLHSDVNKSQLETQTARTPAAQVSAVSKCVEQNINERIFVEHDSVRCASRDFDEHPSNSYSTPSQQAARLSRDSQTEQVQAKADGDRVERKASQLVSDVSDSRAPQIQQLVPSSDVSGQYFSTQQEARPLRCPRPQQLLIPTASNGNEMNVDDAVLFEIDPDASTPTLRHACRDLDLPPETFETCHDLHSLDAEDTKEADGSEPAITDDEKEQGRHQEADADLVIARLIAANDMLRQKLSNFRYALETLEEKKIALSGEKMEETRESSNTNHASQNENCFEDLPIKAKPPSHVMRSKVIPSPRRGRRYVERKQNPRSSEERYSVYPPTRPTGTRNEDVKDRNYRRTRQASQNHTLMQTILGKDKCHPKTKGDLLQKIMVDIAQLKKQDHKMDVQLKELKNENSKLADALAKLGLSPEQVMTIKVSGKPPASTLQPSRPSTVNIQRSFRKKTRSTFRRVLNPAPPSKRRATRQTPVKKTWQDDKLTSVVF